MRALYVHIPFCDHICSYCDFCKVFYQHDWAERYLDALSFEIEDKKIYGDYDTIYIGGGTPSSLSFHQLEKLLKLLEPFSHNVKEYSIEVNPESMDEEKIKLFIKYHINRISIGVQTFHDDLLSRIERYHTSQKAIEIIQLVKQYGIKDINIDLIYGLPNQQLHHVFEDIDIIDKLDISHVSIYSLILEDHTLLKNQNYQLLNDEEDAYWYDEINRYLKEKDFIHYEVSNYYKIKPSYHNLVYWHDEDYEGIGLGAHSLKNHYRYENTRSLTQYFNHHYLYQSEKLNNEDELFEKIMMGLRLIEGIDIEGMNQCFNIDFIRKYQNVIDKYFHLNMLVIKGNYLKTTALGIKYLNNILVDFLSIED